MINRKSEAGFQSNMQRHHLLPLQLLSARSFGRLFQSIGRERIDFNDFRTNGLLLPANEHGAMRMSLPLHRGPHGNYNQMVAERVGQIEGDWSRQRTTAPEHALAQAHMRLALLQKALRRQLLSDLRRPRLNRNDPLGTGRDYSHLDAMAEQLWAETGGEESA